MPVQSEAEIGGAEKRSGRNEGQGANPGERVFNRSARARMFNVQQTRSQRSLALLA
jgi:hypothetical protein